MSKITYKSICDKLGFDPQTRTNEDDIKSFEDWKIVDVPNPYSSLSLEELDFLEVVLAANSTDNN